jgi:uncharacterized protein YdhG (YjbR/CyaY superfamily)
MGTPLHTPAKSVDEYLARVPPKQRAALKALRKTIRSAAPEAEEGISYQIPTFKQDGMLVSFAAFETHCSFFPGSHAHWPQFAKEMKPFKSGKGTLQFSPERPIPASLVRKIVKVRLADNQARAAARKAPRKK